MNIYLPCDSLQTIGGAWSFRRNLAKGLIKIGNRITELNEANIALVTSTSMVTKETINAIKDKGIKMIVRLDNVPRNSRNRNTGTSRLKGFSQIANEIVWQSEWSRWYLEDFIGRKGKIIHNGIDSDIYNTEGTRLNFDNRENTYLYSRFNRDETKNWEVAWYKFQLIYRVNPKAKLMIIGKFSPELVEYNFDFFRGENIEFRGIINNPEEIATIMRSCKYLMATYFNDCFSNTYLEALCCGMELYEPNMSGGTPEMIKLFREEGREYFTLDRMAYDYEKLFIEVLNKEVK